LVILAYAFLFDFKSSILIAKSLITELLMSLKNDEKYVESTFVDTTVDGIFKFVFRA